MRVSNAMAETPDWAVALLGAGGTLAAGLLALLGVKIGAKPAQDQADVAEEAMIRDGLKELLASTRAALMDTRLALEANRAELVEARAQRDQFRTLLEEEQTRSLQMSGELHQLRAVVEGLERLLRKHGLPVPLRRAYGVQPHEIVETTLRQDGKPSTDGGD